MRHSAGMVTMTALTWNVLADAYVRPSWFPLTDPALLVPGARQAAVLAMISDLDVDVVALQEADVALVEAARTAWSDRVVLWAPKGRGRPDGCLTAVRRGLSVTSHQRVEYTDGEARSGHVAHLVTIATAVGSVTFANTHLRWSPDDAPGSVHVEQIAELVDLLGGTGACGRPDGLERPSRWGSEGAAACSRFR